MVIVVLLSRLPDATFATTQAMLVLASGATLLLLALAVFLGPARRLVGSLFGVVVKADGPVFAVASADEWRGLVKPLFTALVLLAVAGLPVLLR